MAGIKERLIQFVLRGKDELSPEAKKSAAALEALREEAESLGNALDSAKEARGLAKALENTQRAVEQSQRSLKQTEQRVTDLRQALSESPEAAGLQQSLKDAEREASRTRKQLLSLNTALTDQEKAAKAAGIDTSKLADEEKRLTAEVDKAKTAVAGNGQQLKALQREQAAASRTAAEHNSRIAAGREVMARSARQVLAFAAAYVSLNAVFGLVQRGLNLVGAGIRAVIADGTDNEQALAQLEAALTSTGNAAGFTAEQLQDMAAKMRASSMLTTEQILAAQTRLLSYTDIVGEQFPKALQTTIDQAQRLGISVEQSAEIVGRALQSPADAMAALGRQGFKLEDGQKRLLRQLVATGKTAEAQAVIMDMLTEAYGGSAAAARLNTFAGLWKTVTDQFSDFAGRVASSGAFDFIRSKLQQVADGIDRMDKDGRLDKLATSLSKAFVEGAEKVEAFALKLLDVDFQKLTDDSTAWLDNFGTKIDEMATSVKLFVAPFRTLFNGLTAGLSGLAVASLGIYDLMLSGLEKVAARLPDILGGAKLKTAVAGAREVLNGMQAGFVAQIEQDGQDIRNAWDTNTEHVKRSAKEQTEAISLEAVAQADYVRQAVTSMQGALDQISAARTVSALRQIGEEMFEAYRRGDLAQGEFNNGLMVLNGRMRELGGAARSTSTDVKGAAASLKTLLDVQNAISNAKTAVDISNINAALRKLYNDGVITAAEYNTELKRASDRQKELKGEIEKTGQAGKAAGEQLTASQIAYNEALEDGIVTNEELRRISGKRMEEERRASGEAMERNRKDGEETKRDMGAMEDFFGGVMSRAREPLAAMSEAALEAFDRLNNISTANVSLDTSSLDATRRSIGQATEALAQMKTAASAVGTSSIGEWMARTAVQSQQLQVNFLAQKSRLQSLMEGYEAGSITVQQFVRRAQSARHTLGLLNDSDLRTLDGAIKSAQDRMEQMAKATRSTLEGLQDELDGLQGRQEDIERRKFAARQRDLQAQLAEAQAGGDAQAAANAARAIGMLRQIEAETAQQRQRDEQQKRIETTAPAAAVQPAAPAKIIRLETSRGKSVEVGVNSAADETNLLSILADAGLRSL